MNLLGNAQTLLGVLVTLIVLCLFNGDASNFLQTLFDHIGKDLADQIKQYTQELKDTFKGTLTEGLQLETVYWQKQFPEAEKKRIGELYNNLSFANIEFYNEATGRNKFGTLIKEFSKRKEIELIELHLMILSIFVMVCDLFFTESPAIIYGFLLIFLLSFLYTTNLWKSYCTNKQLVHDPSCHPNFDNKERIKKILPIVGLSILPILAGLFIFFFSLSAWIYLLFQALWIVGFNYWHSKKRWRTMELLKFNNRFAVKHLFWMIVIPALVTFLIYLMAEKDWIYCWVERCGFADLADALDLWTLNFKSTFSFHYVGAAYTCYVALYSIFVPIIVGYIITRKCAKDQLEIITELYNDYIKDIESQKEYYKELVSNYLKDVTDRNKAVEEGPMSEGNGQPPVSLGPQEGKRKRVGKSKKQKK